LLQRHALDETARSEEEKPPVAHLVVPHPEEQQQEAQRVRALLVREKCLDSRLEFRTRNSGRIRAEDPRGVANEPGERLVATALFVRQATPADDAPIAGGDEGGELPREPRLADPGRPDERDEMRAPLVDSPAPEGLQQLELAVAANQRRRAERPLCGPRHRLDGEPGLGRLSLAL